MAKAKGKVTKLHWEDLPGAEERLQELRTRDLEIAKVALGLQMRTRITNLEGELGHLRAMEQTWRVGRMGRIYYASRTLLRKLAKSASKK